MKTNKEIEKKIEEILSRYNYTHYKNMEYGRPDVPNRDLLDDLEQFINSEIDAERKDAKIATTKVLIRMLETAEFTFTNDRKDIPQKVVEMAELMSKSIVMQYRTQLIEQLTTLVLEAERK
jgi:hypothetical protein